MLKVNNIAFVLLAFALTACGAGGGDRGACLASAQTCAAPAPTSPNTTPAITIDASRINSISCDDVTTLAQALAYLAAGSTQLDADNDGKPCEDKFPQ